MLGDAKDPGELFPALALEKLPCRSGGGVDVGMSRGAVCHKRRRVGRLGTHSGHLTCPVGSERLPRVASKVNLKDKYQ